jgi:hypothetical protein
MEAAVATTAAVEWKITVEGKDAFGELCRHEIAIGKSWDGLSDGEIGLSVEDGKKIMAALHYRSPLFATRWFRCCATPVPVPKPGRRSPLKPVIG